MENGKAKKRAKRSLYLWIIIAILAVVGGTYAWFTFQTTTNVDPNTAGTITNGEGGLLISNSPDGPFSEQCDLKFISSGESLDPLSTENLANYYEAVAQNSKGISVLYSDATDKVDRATMHGKLYLKANTSLVDVYLYTNRMTFGSSTQAIAAMRLGMNITLNGTTTRYIFKLDDMADTSTAEKKITTTKSNVVVSSVTNGRAAFATDPAVSIGSYSAVGKNSEDLAPLPGQNKLTTLKAGQVAAIEYWLYLEGCDENCINSVQTKDVELRLSFAGEAIK